MSQNLKEFAKPFTVAKDGSGDNFKFVLDLDCRIDFWVRPIPWRITHYPRINS